MSTPDLVLSHLLDQPTGSDDAGNALSEQIHHRLRQLRQPVRGLRLRWFRDASQPTNTAPVLMAHPQAYHGPKAEAQFAQAVAVLADGKYESYLDSEEHTVFEATTALGGIDTVIEYVVWRYDDPSGVATRLPDLIRQHQR